MHTHCHTLAGDDKDVIKDVQGWHILEKVWQTGREVLGTAKVHLWVEGKSVGEMYHSEFVMEKHAGSTYTISINFLAPAGKKNKPLLS